MSNAFKFAPGAISSSDENRFKENPRAVAPSFRKKGYRVEVVAGDRKVAGHRLFLGRLREMNQQVSAAEQGRRLAAVHDSGTRSYAQKSTFPSFYSSIGFQGKKDFIKVYHSREGVKFKRLGEQAIHDLNKGYSTHLHESGPNKEWLVKTRQVFDNKNVVFRRIRGRIVPMRVSRPRAASDEVPF